MKSALQKFLLLLINALKRVKLCTSIFVFGNFKIVIWLLLYFEWLLLIFYLAKLKIEKVKWVKSLYCKVQVLLGCPTGTWLFSTFIHTYDKRHCAMESCNLFQYWFLTFYFMLSIKPIFKSVLLKYIGFFRTSARTKVKYYMCLCVCLYLWTYI